MTETLVPWKPDFNVKPDRCSCEFCRVMALLYLEMRLRWETPWREKFGKGLRSRYVRNRTLVVVPVLRKVATRITQMQGFLQLQPKDLVETSEQIEGLKVSFHTDVSSPRSGRIDPRVSPALERSVNLSGCLEMWNVTTTGDVISWICMNLQLQGLKSGQIPVAVHLTFVLLLFCYPWLLSGYNRLLSKAMVAKNKSAAVGHPVGSISVVEKGGGVRVSSPSI